MNSNLTTDPLQSPQRGPAFGWMSSLRFLIGTYIYCYGIIHFARIHVAAEALVSVVFVALAVPWFRLEGEWVSRIRLMVIESLFIERVVPARGRDRRPLAASVQTSSWISAPASAA